jgi:protein-tyrosine-phosphatase
MMKIVAMGLALLAAGLWGQELAPKKVVFVCEHGAAKSVLAKAELERVAKEKGLVLEVISRGTVPDAEMSAGVRKGLLGDGVDLGTAKPVKLSAQDLEGAAAVVSFGPDLTEWMPKGSKTVDWSATPSPSKGYAEARDYIRKRMEELLADLAKRKK